MDYSIPNFTDTGHIYDTLDHTLKRSTHEDEINILTDKMTNALK